MGESTLVSRSMNAALAQRVLELEALVNSQAGTIEALETQLAEIGTRSGGYWEFVGDEFAMAPPVRHQRCRGR